MRTRSPLLSSDPGRMPAPRVCGTPAHGHLRGPHTGGTIRTGPLGFSGGAEHAKSGPRGPWAVTGCSLQEEGGPGLQRLTKESSEGECDSGQAFSVSMPWYSVPKRRGGKKSQEEKERSVFFGFPTFFRRNKASWLCSGAHKHGDSCQENAGFRSAQPRGARFQAQGPSRRPPLREASVLPPVPRPRLRRTFLQWGRARYTPAAD